MSKQVIPYTLSIGDSRQSIPLNRNLKKILALKLKMEENQLQISSMFGNAKTSSAKILMGPEPKTRLVVLFNKINLLNNIRQVEDSLFYCELVLVDLGTSELRSVTILNFVLKDSDKVRDIVTHPKGSSLFTVVYEDKIQSYKLSKPSQIAYSSAYKAALIETQTYNFGKSMKTSDIQYHPDGKSLIGFLTENSRTKVFKFQMATKNMKLSEQMNQKCLGSNPASFKKWAISINKNIPSKAVVVGNLQKICYLDLDTLKFELYSILQNYGNFNYVTMVPPTHNDRNSNSYMLSSASFVNSTNKGIFYLFQPSTNEVFLFESTPKFQYIKTLNFSSDTIFGNIYDRSKCVDISSINSVLCMRQLQGFVKVSKYDINANKFYQLAVITPSSKEVINNDTFGNLNIEDITYSQTTSQACLLYDTVFRCYKIKTKCTSNSDEKRIQQCNNECKSVNPNTYWDPMSMSCITCIESCKCKEKNEVFDPYFQKCVLNCSNQNLALPNSQYQNKQKCACKDPFSWDNNLKKCRYNCSSIKYSDPKADVSFLEPTSCSCLRGFRFLKKLGANDTVGICQLTCPDGKDAQVLNDLPLCICSNQQTWNTQKFACMYKNGTLIPNKYSYPEEVKKSTLPGWAIALIVIFSLLILAFLGLFIWKKIKNRKIEKNRESIQSVPQSSERNQRSENKKSQQQLNEIRTCHICKMNDVNCMSPCGHYFHFYCIKQKLSEQSNQCPECLKQFQNGIADIKLVEKQQQCFTISQN